MARLLGPDMSGRAVFLPSGTPGRGLVGAVYADAAGTVLASIAAYDGTETPGALITASQVTVDAYGLLPLFWFPDGTTRVWITVNGGPLEPVDADNSRRIGTVETRVTAVEAGAGSVTKAYVDTADTAVASTAATDATTKADAAHAAAVAAAATDATTKANAAAAASVARTVVGAKGQILAATGAAAVGAVTASDLDGKFLKSNSALATGMEWDFFPAHSHTAADIASGTIDIARLPVGTGASQVAAGNAPAAAQSAATTAAATSAASLYVPLAQKAAASGIATLGADVRLPVDQQTSGLLASPMRLPKYVQPSNILATMQSGHGWTNNAGSTLIANDTTDGNFCLGTQSVRITTGGTGATANLSKVAMTSFDATAKMVRIRYRLSDVAHLNEFGFFLGSSSFGAFYKWSIQVSGGSRFAQAGEFVTQTLSFADATASGSPNRAALTDGRCYAIDDNTAVQIGVNLQSVELIPDGSASFPNGLVSVTFDDSYASQWTYGQPRLSQYGYPATLFTIDEYIGQGSRLTLDQLKACQDRLGWEIGGHAHVAANHSSSYTGVTAATLEADIAAQRAQLQAWGLRGADGSAYPLGQFGLTSDSQSTMDIVRRNWSYVRTTSARTVETFPPADRYRLRASSGISSFAGGTAPSAITAATTGAIARAKANSAWLILVFHDIVTSGVSATSQILQSDYNAIIDAINTAGMPVLTVGDALRYYG